MMTLSRSLMLLLTGLLVVLPACGAVPVRATRAWHGSTPISASYRFGRLTADLPPGVAVEPTMVAVRATLLRQGHTIESAEATPSEGRVVGLAPESLGYNKVTVQAAYQGQGTVLRIDVSPQNENRSRAFLETLLASMGL